MIEIINMMLLALFLSSIAAIWDLLTTEVPDEIPALMISSGLFFWYIRALHGDATPFMYSLLTGTVVLIIGLVLYKHGKWGGADAWILAAMFYMIPVVNSRPFAIDYIYNLLVVSSAYAIAYAIVLGFLNRRVFGYFLKDLKGNAKLFSVFLLAASAAIFFAPSPFASIVLLAAFLLFFWRYAKIIENKVFTRRIPARNLKVGDVLQTMIWRGLTYEEVRRLRRTKKFITIKEGMRFVPVFPITLAVTLLYGNLLFWFL